MLIGGTCCGRGSGGAGTNGCWSILDELDIGIFDIFKIVVRGHFSVIIKIYEDKIVDCREAYNPISIMPIPIDFHL